MDRQTQYAYEVPAETDFLSGSRFAYEALGLLAMDLLGTGALVAGLAAAPTSPQSLNVKIAPGRIYAVQNLEPTAWGLFNGVGGLAVDTNADHNILKQGIFRDTTAFACAAPAGGGNSINYLIQAAFSETDALPMVLPFVSATAPYPPIAPNTLNTVRQDACVISVKAGTPAPTGTQTTPAPDSGCVGLWVVTVANGVTTINSGNISAYSPSSFISETLTQKISQATGDARYLQQVNARIRLQADTTFYVSTTGNNANSGLDAGHPWATRQYAADYITTNIDTNGFQATVQLADGTYTDTCIVRGLALGSTKRQPIIFNGNAVTPANVTINPNGICYFAENSAIIQVQNQKVQCSGSTNDCLAADFGGVIWMGVGLEFGPAGRWHINAGTGGNITATSSYKISGGGAAHASASQGGNVSLNVASATVTITGTPAFSTAFAVATQNGFINFTSLAFSGSATGARYSVNKLSLIDTGGAGPTALPGNSSGTADGTTGGYYN